MEKSNALKDTTNQINYWGYARVSTKHQKEDRQVEALLNYDVPKENIFIDKASGNEFYRELKTMS